MKYTFRQLRDRLNTLTDEQLDAEVTAWSKWWDEPDKCELCFDHEIGGEPYFYVWAVGSSRHPRGKEPKPE